MNDTWRTDLLDQLEFYWAAHLMPRLAGLTDDEYFWEPVSGCWSVRPGTDGEYHLEQFSPDPPTPPLTTIAWRVVHVGRDIFGTRARAFFGPTPGPDDADMYDTRHWPEPLPHTGADAIAFLEQAYTLWHDGVAALSDEELRQPLGPKGAAFAEEPMAKLVLHINREVMAHGAEICLLRDLYQAHRDREDPLVAACLAGDAATVAAVLAGWHGDVDVAGVRAARPELVAEAAGLRHWSVVRELVTAGFEVNGGRISALHSAAAAGALDEVRFLVEHGADLAATDAEFGLPPAGWADHFGHTATADYLRHPS
ncbi:DinB family protein [Phytoactinopolyspora halotolerans]|uniref:DinB family protein n=1 Tax=Phytoactinopolyspora halotolerans TaxID=1981512 RepID=A0A6L9SDA3_9ACTN|nr:DinB family protein [Phytoactinopolyspora halotolerans]NEE02528.1 DinB family protein [Phytoactinopolyspora halotolerans]